MPNGNYLLDIFLSSYLLKIHFLGTPQCLWALKDGNLPSHRAFIHSVLSGYASNSRSSCLDVIKSPLSPLVPISGSAQFLVFTSLDSRNCNPFSKSLFSILNSAPIPSLTKISITQGIFAFSRPHWSFEVIQWNYIITDCKPEVKI